MVQVKKLGAQSRFPHFEQVQRTEFEFAFVKTRHDKSTTPTLTVAKPAKMSAQQTKQFQKGERVIPAAEDKAQKYYSAEDDSQAKKVCTTTCTPIPSSVERTEQKETGRLCISAHKRTRATANCSIVGGR